MIKNKSAAPAARALTRMEREKAFKALEEILDISFKAWDLIHKWTKSELPDKTIAYEIPSLLDDIRALANNAQKSFTEEMKTRKGFGEGCEDS